MIAKLLDDDGGCAWHREQTHESLCRYLIEEAAETADSIVGGSAAAEVAGELGDVLYQVLFHAELAARAGEGYDFDAVCEALAVKLIARHPHVFSDPQDLSSEHLNRVWESLKTAASKSLGQADSARPRGVFEGIAATMPTLAKAVKMSERLHNSQGFEWLLESPVTAAQALESETALGEYLLQLVAMARARGFDADLALRKTLAVLHKRVE